MKILVKVYQDIVVIFIGFSLILYEETFLWEIIFC
jgi:hypothetical protein